MTRQAPESSDAEEIAVSRFDYDLPPRLIAQHPIEQRDASRLLVVNRATGAIADRTFRDLPDFLREGDLIVVNDTRVFPARLIVRRSSGGAGEILLLSTLADGNWLALARPGRRLAAGDNLRILDANDNETDAVATIVERRNDQFVVAVDGDAVMRHGRVPLPPYIREGLDDAERYQTVYASALGSAAAPTAGLHFTDAVVSACETAGATFMAVTLHVGLDTFQPIKTDNAREHVMHSEWFSIQDTAPLREARRNGRRIIAVGTTVVRTLESAAPDILNRDAGGTVEGWTDMFITPGYRFQIVDGMLTNFHLPRTTLMLLVSAFAGEGHIRAAYEHAVRNEYRFLSFGDAMLIV